MLPFGKYNRHLEVQGNMGATPKVIVGMSGGVDSSVTALLLREQGLEVEGLFMKNWDEDDGTAYCTAAQDYRDALDVCRALDIPLREVSFSEAYWDQVFEQFLAGLGEGITPNPDVLCNREIKFGHFSACAKRLGADSIATGHYARLSRANDAPELLKARDKAKDQSYFLQMVPREKFRDAMFPLGDLEKPDVRRIAMERGLKVAEKRDSTGLCFIGERPFRDFLRTYLPARPGLIETCDERVLGEHIGLSFYTIGQRKGLGVGGVRGQAEKPWYVVGKDMAENKLLVSQNESDLFDSSLIASGMNWLCDPPSAGFRCHAKIRYRQADQACFVEPLCLGDDVWRVRFDHPQRAITPGQYVALYDGERCLGGGLILRNGLS